MKPKIQSIKALKVEMIAVARGKRKAPADARLPSFDSPEAVMRLLTPENRHLLAMIAARKPASVAELAQLVGRAEPNVSRSLARLVDGGFVRMSPGVGKAKVPEVLIQHV